MIEIRPMDADYLHLGCLHGGPIDTTTVEPPRDPLPTGHPPHPWTDETLREIAAAYREHGISHPYPAAFQREMTRRYGTCAILAWEGRHVVGHLRFCPMRVARVLAGDHPDPCPVGDCTLACEPQDDEGTLWVQCVMTCAPYEDSRTGREVGARKGTGLRLAQGLIAWAQEHGWRRIVKIAPGDLDCFYGILGSGGKSFWTKAGFAVDGAFYKWPDPPPDFRTLVLSQAEAKGMTERDAWTWYRMVCEMP